MPQPMICNLKNITKRTSLVCVFLFVVTSILWAQKEGIQLICPLNEATIVPPPKTQPPGEPDLCIVVHSITDTVVKAVTNGKVSNIEENPDEKGKWDVVFYTRFKNTEYYFWYSGLTTVLVKPNQVLKLAQPVGYIKPGEKIELLMYDFETPVDPTKYISCK